MSFLFTRIHLYSKAQIRKTKSCNRYFELVHYGKSRKWGCCIEGYLCVIHDFREIVEQLKNPIASKMDFFQSE